MHTQAHALSLYDEAHTRRSSVKQTQLAQMCVCVCVCVCVIWMECIEAQTALRVSLPLKFNLCWTSKPELK